MNLNIYNKTKSNKVIIYFLLFVIVNIILLILVGAIFYLSVMDYKVNQFNNEMYLKQNLIDKNLSLYDYKLIGKNNYISDYNISTYYKYLVNDYKYDKNYNCKYWAFNWGLYLKKHNYKYKYITLDTHIFVVAWNDNNYYVIDENTLLKRRLI